MAFEYLNRYLERVRRRLLAGAVLKGAAIAAAVALAMTVLLVAINYRLDIQPENWNWSRALLFLSIAGALTFGIVMPVLLINRRRAAQRIESAVPGLDQRLMTCLENKDQTNPMVALVAEQAWERARGVEPSQLVKSSWLASFAGTAAVSVGVLAWLILGTPGWIGQGSALLWGGIPKANSVFNRELKVEPGSTKVRRRADQMITAKITGMNPPSVKIFARFHKAAKWEEVPMMPINGSVDEWNFLFAGLADSVDYYVVAGSLKSQQYTLTAVDLPGVKKIKTTYKFPAWSGMPDEVENPGGDLRAVTGTSAYLEIETDKPLENPVLVMDNGTRVPVTSSSPTKHLVTVGINRDGAFHVAMLENGKAVRLSDDYFIEALKEGPPEIKISRPGRDAKVSPIEEVAFAVEATDDFGLTSMTLHYSVNGGQEQTVNLPVKKGSKTGEGTHMLALEDFKLSPGDNVMFYAKARDAKSESTTDVFFLEAQPYERELRQSQQMGGGGGGGGEQQDGNIVQRQKEIISATFQEEKGKKPSAEQKENAKFLSDTQEKLRQQAQTFVQRIRARQLAGQNETIEAMAKDMTEAANAMTPAVEALRSMKFKDALPHEQKALQYLQRAEARRKEIEVAMGQQGGGGGGGMQRDLESLLDLELDTEKNQYETGQQMSAEQKQKEVDEAMRKLEELARRQQELANGSNPSQQASEKRWQQEMLRREAEKLQQELERLQKNQQQSQQQQGSQSASSSSSSSGQQGQQGQQSQQQSRQQNRLNRDPRVDKAMEQLKEATNDMRRASSNQQQGQQSEGEARRAAERLNEAKNLLREMEKQGREQQLSDLSRRSEEIARRQREFENKMKQQYGQGDNRNPGARSDSFREGQDPQTANRLADEKTQLMEDYQKLEKDLQDAARQLRGSQRSASAKLQEGLGDAQKEDLNLKLKMMSEYIRRGYGQYMSGREREISRALDNLRDKVKEAEKMAGPGGTKSDPTEKALAQVEQLRQQVAELTRQQQQAGNQQGNQQGNQKGQQKGQGQQGQQGQGQQQGQQGGQQGGQGQQPGQGQGQQAGNQQGQQGQQGQQAGNNGGRGQDGRPNEQRGGGGSSPFRDYGAMNTGQNQPNLPNAPEVRSIERNFSQSLRDLEQMRGRLGGTAEDQAEIQKLLKDMAALDPNKFKGNPALVEQMRSQLLPVLEQLELKLRRDVEGKEGAGEARSATPDRVPSGYADQVAEYFRRLSKGSAVQKKN